MASTSSTAISMTRRRCAGRWPAPGASSACRTLGKAGVEREEAQGKRLATLAREAGVEHYVYTSVGSAHKQTGVPHFDNKWRARGCSPGLEGHRRQPSRSSWTL